jgi:hypothetical protein
VKTNQQLLADKPNPFASGHRGCRLPVILPKEAVLFAKLVILAHKRSSLRGNLAFYVNRTNPNAEH